MKSKKIKNKKIERLTDIENKFMVTKGETWEGRIH